MNLLAIDTSTEKATVALSIGNEMVCEELSCLRQHAQVLLPMIERLLALTSSSFQQLDAISFGRGPGSFTGLRIACSIAKALAYAHDLPLYPVSCLSAIAWGAQQLEIQNSAHKILAVMDARMKEYYWGCFEPRNFSTEELVTAPDKIQCGADFFILAGVGFDVSSFNLNLQQQMISQHVIYPEAQFMVGLVRAGQVAPVSAAEALPVYVRNQVTQGDSRG
jgi:tRNA threonylcarbamoyladenosine biosynthesis protein TsaB